MEELFQLEEMSQKDDSKKIFRPSEHGGFDVLDKSVFDDALLVLEKNVQQHATNIEERVFITIEFAREDYEKAFKQFSQAFLQDTYFLFINTDFETCKKRIHERINHRITADDHFISDFALDTYYFHQYPPQDEDIMRRLTVIENQGSWGDTIKEINSIVQQILKKH